MALERVATLEGQLATNTQEVRFVNVLYVCVFVCMGDPLYDFWLLKHLVGP